MQKVAYIESANTAGILQQVQFVNEYALLKPHFAEKQVELVRVDWRDPQLDWRQFAAIIPKCAWDYFNHYDAFQHWLAARTADKIVFKNAAALIEWNSHKRYLLDLQTRGATILPLQFIEQQQQLELIKIALQEHEAILLKPAVAGGGKQTQVYRRQQQTAALHDAMSMLRECAVIVQPYFPEIVDGEWSYCFFGNTFSHAILKVPKNGDFRAHSLFGGHNRAVTPSAAQIAEAQRFLEFLPQPAHYARVDGIYHNKKLHLMELELIEPYLYFECAPSTAPKHFTNAIISF